MIRPITPEDSAALISLILKAELFPPEETPFLERMLADYFGGKVNEGHTILLDVDEQARGVAYYAPETATDGTWNLLMIAVRPDVQGQGYGKALLRHVEAELRANDQRLLLIQTSGLPHFEATRAFYLKSGYEAEARIRDYYNNGEDMIVYRKLL